MAPLGSSLIVFPRNSGMFVHTDKPRFPQACVRLYKDSVSGSEPGSPEVDIWLPVRWLEGHVSNNLFIRLPEF